MTATDQTKLDQNDDLQEDKSVAEAAAEAVSAAVRNNETPSMRSDDSAPTRKGNRIVFTENLADVSQEAVLRLQGKLQTRNIMLAIAMVCAVIFFATEFMGKVTWFSVVTISIAIGIFIYTQVTSRKNMQRILGEKLNPEAKLKRSVTLTRKDIKVKHPKNPATTHTYDQVKSLKHEEMLILVEFTDGTYLPIPHADLSEKKYEAIIEMLEDGLSKARG